MDRVDHWLKATEPDILCVQETKSTDAKFPVRELELAGYRAIHHGQPTYNGVAILSRHPIEDPLIGWPQGTYADEEARLVAATIAGVRVISAYVPNGATVGSEKWIYKLRWYEHLRATYLDALHDPEQPLLLCGDFNVAPEARDVHDPPSWQDTVLCHPQAREAYQRVLDFGLTATFRIHHEEDHHFSWWDYRGPSFAKNEGVRIDMILATEQLAERCVESWIDKGARRGKKPSDHTVVLSRFDWEL